MILSWRSPADRLCQDGKIDASMAERILDLVRAARLLAVAADAEFTVYLLDMVVLDLQQALDLLNTRAGPVVPIE